MVIVIGAVFVIGKLLFLEEVIDLCFRDGEKRSQKRIAEDFGLLIKAIVEREISSLLLKQVGLDGIVLVMGCQDIVQERGREKLTEEGIADFPRPVLEVSFALFSPDVLLMKDKAVSLLIEEDDLLFLLYERRVVIVHIRQLDMLRKVLFVERMELFQEIDGIGASGKSQKMPARKERLLKQLLAHGRISYISEASWMVETFRISQTFARMLFPNGEWMSITSSRWISVLGLAILPLMRTKPFSMNSLAASLLLMSRLTFRYLSNLIVDKE